MGQVKNGGVNGNGTQTWPSGEVHVGQYKDGTRNGQARTRGPERKRLPSGEVYVGQYKGDKSHGEGKGTWPSGLAKSTWASGQTTSRMGTTI